MMPRGICHTREGGDPKNISSCVNVVWIPAFAGMTFSVLGFFVVLLKKSSIELTKNNNFMFHNPKSKIRFIKSLTTVLMGLAAPSPYSGIINPIG